MTVYKHIYIYMYDIHIYTSVHMHICCVDLKAMIWYSLKAHHVYTIQLHGACGSGLKYLEVVQSLGFICSGKCTYIVACNYFLFLCRDWSVKTSTIFHQLKNSGIHVRMYL